MAEKQEFSKFERARIIGARGLQIAMDAPLLKKFNEEDLSNLNFDPLRLAEAELDSGVLPISVNRPMPEKRLEKLKKLDVEKEKGEVDDAKKQEIEAKEEEDIKEQGEIMELAMGEEDNDSGDSGGGVGIEE